MRSQNVFYSEKLSTKTVSLLFPRYTAVELKIDCHGITGLQGSGVPASFSCGGSFLLWKDLMARAAYGIDFLGSMCLYLHC